MIPIRQMMTRMRTTAMILIMMISTKTIPSMTMTMRTTIQTAMITFGKTITNFENSNVVDEAAMDDYEYDRDD